MTQRLRGNGLALLLLLVTVVWGWTFPLVKDAAAQYGVVAFLAVRFTLAALVMLPLGLVRGTRESWAVGAGIGLLLAAAYLFQTFGIIDTTATNSGLITGLFVVFAPLCNRVLFGVRTDGVFAGAIVTSLVGLVLLTGVQRSVPTVGDLLTVGCALCFGLQIAFLDRYSGRFDPFALAAAQLACAALIFTAVLPFALPVTAPTGAVWFALLVTALLATAGGFTIQTVAQQHLAAVRVALILSMEPVFAALFGRVVAGDRLSWLQLLGGVLMVAAFVVANVHQVRKSNHSQPPA